VTRLPGAPELAYRDARLYLEGVALDDLGRRFGTPLYVYSSAGMGRALDGYRRALAGRDHLLCYAINVPVTSTLAVQVGNQFSTSPPGSPGIPTAIPVTALGSPDQLCLPSFKTVNTNPLLPEVPYATLLPLSALVLAGGWFIVRGRRRTRTADLG